MGGMALAEEVFARSPRTWAYASLKTLVGTLVTTSLSSSKIKENFIPVLFRITWSMKTHGKGCSRRVAHAIC